MIKTNTVFTGETIPRILDKVSIISGNMAEINRHVPANNHKRECLSEKAFLRIKTIINIKNNKTPISNEHLSTIFIVF